LHFGLLMSKPSAESVNSAHGSHEFLEWALNLEDIHSLEFSCFELSKLENVVCLTGLASLCNSSSSDLFAGEAYGVTMLIFEKDPPHTKALDVA